MQEGMQLWIEYGIDGGSFLMSILSNDFLGACSRADYINQKELFSFAMFLANEAPIGCFGSPAIIENWKGLKTNE
ncbi:hypothetical protein HOE37_06685 [Candidatus Woesearchaeota archaeon]|nr:hypothetical protein [Candidatus Woesearchaeota archaeon]